MLTFQQCVAALLLRYYYRVSLLKCFPQQNSIVSNISWWLSWATSRKHVRHQCPIWTTMTLKMTRKNNGIPLCYDHIKTNQCTARHHKTTTSTNPSSATHLSSHATLQRFLMFHGRFQLQLTQCDDWTLSHINTPNSALCFHNRGISLRSIMHLH